MDCHLVGKRHYPEIFASEFRDRCPKSKPVALLRLNAHGSIHHANAQLLVYVRALAKHLVLEVLREPVCRHLSRVRYLLDGRKSGERSASAAARSLRRRLDAVVGRSIRPGCAMEPDQRSQPPLNRASHARDPSPTATRARTPPTFPGPAPIEEPCPASSLASRE